MSTLTERRSNAFQMLSTERDTLRRQRDELLQAAKAAEPYLKDRVLNDYIDIENARTMLRTAIKNCEQS
jgi:hypothetical protein